MNSLNNIIPVAPPMSKCICLVNDVHKYSPNDSSASIGAKTIPTTKCVSSASRRLNQHFNEDDNVYLNGNRTAPTNNAHINGFKNGPNTMQAPTHDAITAAITKL